MTRLWILIMSNFTIKEISTYIIIVFGILSTIFKFCVIGLVISPYFYTVSNLGEKLHICQIITTVGIGLNALSDLTISCNINNDGSKSSLKSGLDCVIYSAPTVSTFMIVHSMLNDNLTETDYSMSLWIVLTFFTMLALFVLNMFIMCLYGCCCVKKVTTLNGEVCNAKKVTNANGEVIYIV